MSITLSVKELRDSNGLFILEVDAVDRLPVVCTLMDYVFVAVFTFLMQELSIMTDVPQNSNLPAPTEMRFPDALPLLVLKDQVVFPMSLAPLTVSEEPEKILIQDVTKGDGLVAVVAHRPDRDGASGLGSVYEMACLSRLVQVQYAPSGELNVVIQSLSRCLLTGLVRQDPYMVVRVRPVEERRVPNEKLEPLAMALKMQMANLVSLSPTIPDNATRILDNIPNPGYMADIIAANLNFSLDEKQQILATVNPEKRLRTLMGLVQREIELLEVSTKIQDEVKSSFEKQQREYFLRQQLKAIQEELGMGDEAQPEIAAYRDKLTALDLPDEARAEAFRELDRLAKMNEASAEYHVSTTYLDTLIELPWNTATDDKLNIKSAETVLDEDHYGLDKVKKRIVEYLAVRKLKRDAHGPILCFLGPPGTGKTSLGASIARALGRKYVRMSLGGMRDEAEIRGHRKTYVGALPGRIIQGLRKAGSKNPVFILDEIDKVGNDFRGDPSSALLEVLDPAQNNAFVDHYLNVPFDLSDVMFIATANMADTIPWALRDRMEIIDIPSYTQEEKLQIARKYLVPRQLEEHGLTASQLRFGDPALRKIISGYTREAGVRNLNREIGHVCRGCARKFAARRKKPIQVAAKDLKEYLGSERNFYDTAQRTRLPGVVIGLAWTPVGGDILFIEATRMPGKGNLLLTGQLGDVMKESAQAALSFIRANAAKLGIEKETFSDYDLHIHFPAGAVQKDGPSAGLALLTALTSLFLGKRVKHTLAMTGEITLRGVVLPVGGVKEKVLAAIRAGIKEVILPERCGVDLEEIPKDIRAKLTVHLVKRMDEVLRIALGVEI